MGKIADRLISGSAVNLMGKLHDLSGKPGYYSFASGMPNEDTFPVAEMTKASEEVLDSQWNEALQYNSTDQYEPLKKFVVSRYAKAGLNVTEKDILITSSSTQALDICAKTFIDSGDLTLIERPSFMGAINTFKIYDSRLIDVPFKEGGLDLDVLEERLRQKPKLAYFLPTFQNPTGLTYSLENREKVGELIQKTDTIVLEDDPYGELRFYGEKMPPLKAFIGDQGLILGTFSKIVSPGMRLGWICCTDPELMASLYTVKRQCDIAAEGISLRAMNRYLTEWDFEEHIKEATGFYQKNADVMMESMDIWFPKEVTYYKAEGGLFIWCELPEYISVTELFNACSEKNVLFFPGSTFYIDPADGEHSLRLSYSCTDAESIREGIRIMGTLMREMVQKHNCIYDEES